MSERDAIERLRDLGFTADFTAVEGGLRLVQTGEVVRPEDAHIVHVFRFEGASDISDEAVVYGIETKNARGVLVDAYGPYASPELAAIIDRMPNDRVIPKAGDRPPKPW